jgi:hypothetical protein
MTMVAVTKLKDSEKVRKLFAEHPVEISPEAERFMELYDDLKAKGLLAPQGSTIQPVDVIGRRLRSAFNSKL